MAMQPRPSLEPLIFMSADSVLNWQPTSVNPLMVSGVPIARRTTPPPSDQRFLAGLDNGEWSYWPQFDRYPQGGPLGSVYNFQFWQYVDDAYYYMHALAAVPPVVWTNAAHRNGVRMFAAVTSDFDTPHGGVEFNKLFEDPGKAADQLFELVNRYRFDGWLIDVEGGADSSPNVVAAMKALRQRILWNGSLVEVGFYEAGAQSMNDAILPFFKAGSFFQSDYAWNGNTFNFPQQTYNCLDSNGLAAARFNTYWAVYTNNFSDGNAMPGGLFNGRVYLDVKGFFDQIALAKAPPPTDYYQSIGIYAPDWTMYGGISDNKCPLPPRDTFQRTERLLWQGMAIGPDRKPVTISQSVSDFIPPRSTLVAPPFLTRFNTGQGSFFNLRGQRAVAREWNYLCGQDLLPTQIVQAGTPDPNVTADYTYEDAYDGGTALAFRGTLAATKTIEYPLFTAAMPLQTAQNATFRYKPNGNTLLPYVRVVYSNRTSQIVPPTSGQGWVQIIQRLSPPAGAQVIEIRIGFQNANPSLAANVDILLGELGIVAPSNFPPPPTILVTPIDNLLTWTPSPGVSIWYYNVFGRTANGSLTFIGRSVLPSYDLTVPLFPIDAVAGNQYLIQPFTTNGQAPALPTE